MQTSRGNFLGANMRKNKLFHEKRIVKQLFQISKKFCVVSFV